MKSISARVQIDVFLSTIDENESFSSMINSINKSSSFDDIGFYALAREEESM
jgi:hypothetical protein